MGILELWNAIVEAGAVIAIVMIAIGFMIGMVDAHRALGRLGAVVGCLVSLLILPPILLSRWHSLSFWQQLGIVALVGLVGSIALRARPHHGRKRSWER